jgi:hypothetical protein
VTYFHEEQRFGRWLAVVIFLGVAFFSIAALTASQRPAALQLLLVPLIALLLLAVLMLAKLDVDVDQSGIHIAFHLLWPTRHIPLADVRSARATKYSPLLWGGYGVHYMLLRGWAFNTGGSEGVLVETNHGNVMIGSRRAKELEAAITRAIAERAGR